MLEVFLQAESKARGRDIVEYSRRQATPGTLRRSILWITFLNLHIQPLLFKSNHGVPLPHARSSNKPQIDINLFYIILLNIVLIKQIPYEQLNDIQITLSALLFSYWNILTSTSLRHLLITSFVHQILKCAVRNTHFIMPLLHPYCFDPVQFQQSVSKRLS